MKRLLVPLLALGLLAGACGGSDDSDSGVATLETDNTVVAGDAGAADVAADVDTEQAMMAMAACLRDQGLDIDDPTVDSEGNVQFGGFGGGGTGEEGEASIDRGLMREAMEACQSELEGVTLGFGNRDFDQTEMQDILVEWASCMRENGYDMDDPDLSTMGRPGEGGGGNPFGEIDPEDPDYIAASEACSEILGDAGVPGAGRGTRGGTG